jgi:ParB family chromosome partitioning protein
VARERGMGRGLSAILSVAPNEPGEELRPLPVDLVDPNPNQPRQGFDEDAMVALADSVRANGVLQPVLVRPTASGRYELIAGERRWRAAKLAGMEDVPAVVRPHDDAASLELALVENMAREDLNPIEEARACAALVEELGLTREEVGRRVGRQPHPPARPPRRGDRADRAGRPHRGPRPRAAAGARPWRSSRSRPRRGRQRVVGPRDRGPLPRRRRRRRPGEAAPRPAAARHPPRPSGRRRRGGRRAQLRLGR